MIAYFSVERAALAFCLWEEMVRLIQEMYRCKMNAAIELMCAAAAKKLFVGAIVSLLIERMCIDALNVILSLY